MSVQTRSTTPVLDKIKLWLFPVVVSLLAGVIYREVLEIRSDVKQLLAQSNVDKTKIEILERDVRSLQQAVFDKKTIAVVKHPITDGLYYKHEEIFDINNYLPKKTII